MANPQPEGGTLKAHGGVRPLVRATEAVAAGIVTGGDGGVTAFHDNNGKLLLHGSIRRF